MGYKHLGGKIIGDTIKRVKTEAAVALKSTIDTIVGKTEQTEIYILVLEDGEWLIDEIIVRDEVERRAREKPQGVGN